jgi:hypothetical protein
MEHEVQSDAASLVNAAFEDLCQLIDAIERTTDLIERHGLFRRISRTAEMLGVLRMGSIPLPD